MVYVKNDVHSIKMRAALREMDQERQSYSDPIYRNFQPDPISPRDVLRWMNVAQRYFATID